MSNEKYCCKWKRFGRSLRKNLKDEQPKAKISWSAPPDRHHDRHLFRLFAPAPTMFSPSARKWRAVVRFQRWMLFSCILRRSDDSRPTCSLETTPGTLNDFLQRGKIPARFLGRSLTGRT